MHVIKNIVLPSSLKKLGNYVFQDCTALASVVIPGSVIQIGNGAFYNCASLENVTLSEGLLEIGDTAFALCVSLINIVLPSSLKKLGEYVFLGCKSFESLVIPDNVEQIRDGLCCGCSNLEYVKIGDNTYIYPYPNKHERVPFKECPKLLSIDFNNLDNCITAFPTYQQYHLKQQRLRLGHCLYCGGRFVGLFNKRCSECGNPKNY